MVDERSPEPDERLVLCFHGVGDPPPWAPPDEAPFWCPVDRFHHILDAIPEVTAETGVPIELTFDDGNVSDAHIALPALSERGLRASFFVCVGRLETPGYLDLAMLDDLRRAGMTIGSHGWGHVDWGCADRATLAHEIRGSCRHLAGLIGAAVDRVAVPYGRYGASALREARRAGIRRVYTSNEGRAHRDDTVVPRETVRPAWDAGTLADRAKRPVALAERLRRRAVALKKRVS